MNHPLFYAYLAADFQAVDGRVTNICLVRKSDGKSVGIADFLDEKPSRLLFADNVSDELLVEFQKEAEEILSNSIPQTFNIPVNK